MWKFLKWLGIGLLAYVMFSLVCTGEESPEVRPDEFVERVLSHTDMLIDPRGNDPLAEKLARGTLDSYLTANLLRSGALTVKAAGDPPDTVALRRSLRYIRAASALDTLDSGSGQLLAYILRSLGDPAAAILAAERSTGRLTATDTSTALAWLGGLYLETGQADSALAVFRRQLRLDPENETYYQDTRYYLEHSALNPDSVEAVLIESRVHTGLFNRLGRAWSGAMAWPRRKVAGMLADGG